MPVISSGVPVSSSSPFTIFDDGPGGIHKPEFETSVAMSGVDQYTYFETQAKLQQERDNNQIINYNESKVAKLSISLFFLAGMLVVMEACKTAMDLFLSTIGAGYWGGVIYAISGLVGYLSYKHRTYPLVCWTVWLSILALIASCVIFGVTIGAFSSDQAKKPYVHVTILILAIFGSICSFLIVECGRKIVFGRRTTPESCSPDEDKY